MKTEIKYTLEDDGYWQTHLEVLDPDGYILIDLKLYAVNKISETPLNELKRHSLEAIKGHSKTVE
jgi:hypothetical protein